MNNVVNKTTLCKSSLFKNMIIESFVKLLHDVSNSMLEIEDMQSKCIEENKLDENKLDILVKIAIILKNYKQKIEIFHDSYNNLSSTIIPFSFMNKLNKLMELLEEKQKLYIRYNGIDSVINELNKTSTVTNNIAIQ